jgi:selenocysteine-specific elongation factor
VTELAVGTAGHVDHGKTALIRALTGIDCDTLPEERERGLTIEVGFAAWILPSGREVSVVDVPGHERFIRTMAAGARSIDLALLCVAADDGVMPQTREHAAVLRILGVRRVLPVVTKVDLAPERAGLCAAQVDRLLREVGLAGGPWVACSASTGVGLQELAQAVDHELDHLPNPLDRGLPRLLVDRSFTKVGTGTVVTGVLDGGRLTLGQQIEVFPSSARGRVQTLQRRGQAVGSAEPGGRLAAGLHGVALAEVPRGSVVGPPGLAWPSQSLDCSIVVPAAGARGVRQGMHLEVLAGSASASARIWLAGETELGPTQSGFGQLHLDSPLWSLPGDLLVLRAPSPQAILGGALVLDSHPRRHRRWATSPLEAWGEREQLLVRPGPEGLQSLAVFEAATGSLGLTAQAVAARAGMARDLAVGALERGSAAGFLVKVGTRFFGTERWQALSSRAAALLAEHEHRRPLDPGMPRGHLLTALGLRSDSDGEAALRRLSAEGCLQLVGPLASLPGRPRIATGTAVTERILGLLLRSGRNPPGWAELREAGLTQEVRAHLLRTGDVVALSPQVLILRSVMEEMEADLHSLLAAAPEEGLTVAEIRDGLASSRRIVVPLLERWEREHRTERTGDRHRLRRSTPCQTR